jgi:hypothetical protein
VPKNVSRKSDGPCCRPVVSFLFFGCSVGHGSGLNNIFKGRNKTPVGSLIEPLYSHDLSTCLCLNPYKGRIHASYGSPMNVTLDESWERLLERAVDEIAPDVPDKQKQREEYREQSDTASAMFAIVSRFASHVITRFQTGFFAAEYPAPRPRTQCASQVLAAVP